MDATMALLGNPVGLGPDAAVLRVPALPTDRPPLAMERGTEPDRVIKGARSFKKWLCGFSGVRYLSPRERRVDLTGGDFTKRSTVSPFVAV